MDQWYSKNTITYKGHVDSNHDIFSPLVFSSSSFSPLFFFLFIWSFIVFIWDWSWLVFYAIVWGSCCVRQIFHHSVDTLFCKIKINLINLEELELWGSNSRQTHIRSFFSANIMDWFIQLGEEFRFFSVTWLFCFSIWSIHIDFICDLIL